MSGPPGDTPPLARAAVDRAAHLREDDAWLDAAWRHPASEVFVVSDGRALIDDANALIRTPTADAPAGDRYFLGVVSVGGSPAKGATAAAERPTPPSGLFAVAAPLPDPAPAGSRAASLREVGAMLSDADAGLLSHAAALEQWHARHPRCPLCGTPTEVAMGGHLRRCPTDGSEHHPRTDPAVIMLVTNDDDECLLGRHPDWPPGRMSTLAGYVEAGETLEHAVEREVGEEAGVDVDQVQYVASQPWPFPSSLMLAFTARAHTSEVHVDGVEISEARWFSRAQLRSGIVDGSLRLPMRASIAFYLIARWYGGGLVDIVPAAAFTERR
jgi:NAD+ diphosphatase